MGFQPKIFDFVKDKIFSKETSLCKSQYSALTLIFQDKHSYHIQMEFYTYI